MKKDKAKVLDEVWDDERVAGFLDLRPGDDSDPDYHVLERAYQSMRAEDFERFIAMFVAAGRNLSAPGPDGKPLIQLLSEHRYGEEYSAILLRHSA